MYSSAYEARVWTQTGVVISDWYRLGLVLLASAVVLTIYGLLLRRLRAWDLGIVALAWWAAGAVVVSIAFPGASYLLTWSLVGGSLGLIGAGLVDRPGDGRPAAALVALAGAVPGVVLLSAATYLLLMSAGLKQTITVLAVWLLAGLLMLPLAAVLRAFRFWLAGGARGRRHRPALRGRIHGRVRQRAPEVHQRLLPDGPGRRLGLGVDGRHPRPLYARVRPPKARRTSRVRVLPGARVA